MKFVIKSEPMGYFWRLMANILSFNPSPWCSGHCAISENGLKKVSVFPAVSGGLELGCCILLLGLEALGLGVLCHLLANSPTNSVYPANPNVAMPPSPKTIPISDLGLPIKMSKSAQIQMSNVNIENALSSYPEFIYCKILTLKLDLNSRNCFLIYRYNRIYDRDLFTIREQTFRELRRVKLDKTCFYAV